MDDKEFRLFLSHDLNIMNLDICGPFELYFKWVEAASDAEKELVILRVDHVKKRKHEISIPLDGQSGSLKETLEAYLLEMSTDYLGFTGEPLYRHSDLFTVDEFAAIVSQAKSILKEENKRAKQLARENELLAFFQEKGFDPRPHGEDLTNWTVSCPSGKGHPAMISSTSNEWGCGYCKRKGGLEELKAWMAELERV